MLTMDRAQLIIEAAIDKAKTVGQPMNIAVVDAGAVGVSGGSGEQDQAVAEAAVAACS